MPKSSRPMVTLQNASGSSGRSRGMLFASGVFQRRLLEELVPPNLPAVHLSEMPSGIKNVAANFCQ